MAQVLNELRRVTRRLHHDRNRQHQLIREASANGSTRREVAQATGLSLGAVQKIVRGLGVIALATLALSAAPADAHITRGMAEWQKLGQVYFPDACGPVELDASHTEPEPAPGATAWAYSPLRADPFCRLVIGESFHAYPPQMQCAMIVHEYGHLAGLDHSDDPASIMHPSGSAVPRECESRRIRKAVRMHAGSRR